MSDTLEEQRRAIAGRIMSALRHASAREALGLGPETHIIVAMPDETVADVFRRVYRIGQAVRLVVPKGHELTVSTVTPTPEAPAVVDLDDPCPVHPDSEISMLLDYLTQHRPGEATTCLISTPEGPIECSEPLGPLMVPA